MVHDAIDWTVQWVEAAGALLVLSGLTISLFRLLRIPFLPARPALAPLQIRLGLGMFLALGLEFLLAADILRTAVSPTYKDIAMLAAVATIRTGLNFFLGREFIEGERQLQAMTSAQLDHHAAGPPSLRRVRADGDQPVVRTGLRTALGNAVRGPLWRAHAVESHVSEESDLTTRDT